MDIVIMRDKTGGAIRLTTESACSRYGIPVLRIDADDMPGVADFGPGDIIVPGLSGYDLVLGWWRGECGEKRGTITDEIKSGVRRFLSQCAERFLRDEKEFAD